MVFIQVMMLDMTYTDLFFTNADSSRGVLCHISCSFTEFLSYSTAVVAGCFLSAPRNLQLRTSNALYARNERPSSDDPKMTSRFEFPRPIEQPIRLRGEFLRSLQIQDTDSEQVSKKQA